MYYVYLIRSIPFPDQTYIGYTTDLNTRLKSHNNGQSKHTAKYKPWELVTYTAFSEPSKALSFEKYLNPIAEKPEGFRAKATRVKP